MFSYRIFFVHLLLTRHTRQAKSLDTIAQTISDVKSVTDANTHQLAFATGGLWALMIVFAMAMGLIYFFYVTTRMKRDDEESNDEYEDADGEKEEEKAARGDDSSSSSSSDEETEKTVNAANDVKESDTAPTGDQQPTQTDKEKKDN